MTIAGILVLIGTILAVLDFILYQTTNYSRHSLLTAGVILIGIGCLVGSPVLIK